MLNGQLIQSSRNLCISGRIYPYKRCYYLNTESRPDGWIPQRDVIYKINERMGNNPAVIEHIKITLPGVKPIALTTISDDLPTETVVF